MAWRNVFTFKLKRTTTTYTFDTRNRIGSDNMWRINEKFMDHQWDLKKNFYFSPDPEHPKDLFGGYSYEKEIDYLRSKGVDGFEKTNDGYWKAIRKEDLNE